MYLVLFLDANNYEFNVSLHSSLAAAVAAYEALLQRFILKPGETLPPKAIWGELSWEKYHDNFVDDCGENPHVYQIQCDGKLGEEIHLSDLAAA
jgi:hypothetical protein